MSRLGFALLAVVATAQANTACETDLPTPTSHPAVLTPLAAGFPVPNQGLSGQRKGLIQGFDETRSVDRVLQLRQWEYCRQAITAALTPPAPDTAPAYANTYIKQTEFDNTPYRFNMTQNGQRMTADDFDDWLQANGYNVGRRVELEN